MMSYDANNTILAAILAAAYDASHDVMLCQLISYDTDIILYHTYTIVSANHNAALRVQTSSQRMSYDII